MRNRIVKSGVIAVTLFVVAAAALPAHDQVVIALSRNGHELVQLPR